MNIGNYIHKLLLENEIVIIPGFGAFVSDYKPAEINEETNEMKPPSKEILFNRQIRNNDGLLVGSVAKGEAVSHFDALKLIEKERENIIFQLDKGEKVILTKTGELFINDKNEIGFTPFENENLLLDSFGLEAVELEKVADENKNVVTVAETIQPETEKTEVTATPVPARKITKRVDKPEEKIVGTETTDDEKKKKRGGFWFLLILLPILFVGYFLYPQKGEKKKPEVIETTKPEIIVKNDPVVSLDTVVEDSTSVMEQDTLQATEDTLLTETSKEQVIETDTTKLPKFILVGGSFKAEENANNYLTKLKEKGFSPFLLGKRGNFFIVGIGRYNSEKEALEAKRKFMEENPKSGVWVKKEK